MKDHVIKGLYSVDFLGYKPSIKINSKDRYQTVLGGITSLMIIILSLASVIYFGLEIVIKQQPIVVVSRENYQEIPALNVSAQGFGFYVSLEFSNYSLYIDDTIYTLHGERYSIKNVKDESGNYNRVDEVIPLEFDRCSKFYKPENIPESNYPIDLNVYSCVKPNSAQIENFWGHPTQSLFRVNIKKCQNSTLNNNKCKPKEEINSIIQDGYLSYYMTQYYIDQGNYTHPLQREFYSNFILLNAKSSLDYSLLLKPLRIASDDGFMFSDSKVYNAYELRNDIFMRIIESESIASFTFQGYNVGTVNFRSYSKIQDVITKVGGLIKVLMIFGYFFIEIYSNILFHIDQIEIFGKRHGENTENFVEITNQNINFNTNNNVDINNNNYNNVIGLVNKNLKQNHTTIRNNNYLSKSENKIMQLNSQLTIIPKNNNLERPLRHEKPSYSSLFVTFFCTKFCYIKKLSSNKLFYMNFINSINVASEKVLSIETIMQKFFELEIIKKIIIKDDKLKNLDDLYVLSLERSKALVQKEFLDIFQINKDEVMEFKTTVDKNEN
jgi:hypothetical protein